MRVILSSALIARMFARIYRETFGFFYFMIKIDQNNVLIKRLPIILIITLSFFCSISKAQQIPVTSQSVWTSPAQTTLVHHGTGARAPTKEEIEKSNRTHQRIHKVHLNRLGWQRANKNRQEQKLPTLGEDAIAPKGHEIESSIDTSDIHVSNSAVYINNSSADTVLPSAVDNSTEPWFPPIGDQGSLGSCVSFATTYYQLSYAVAQENNWTINTIVNPGNVYSPADLTKVFSPRWTYNMVNYGVDQGQGSYNPFALLESSGAPAWALFPYNGSDYTTWPTTAPIWLNALSQRINPYQTISDPDGNPTAVQLIKQLLNNGDLIGFTTEDPNKYSYTTIKSCTTSSCNPNGYTIDNTLAGQQAVIHADNTLEHGMTIVGYDDNIWIDINNNGVVDPGEMGAFKVANQWGTGYGNKGFYWISYDALNSISEVANGPDTNRGAIFQFLIFLSVRTNPDGSPYMPQVVGQFTVSDAQRDQLYMSLGVSATNQSVPSSSFSPMFAMAGGGGAISFTGTAVLDFTDIVPSGNNTFYLGMSNVDTTGKYPSTLSSFSLTDGAGNALGGPNTSSLVAEGDQVYSTINYNYTGQLNLNVEQSMGGVITVSPNTPTVPIGTNALITITPDAGYYLYALQDNTSQLTTGNLAFSNGIYTYNLNNITVNHTLSAYFYPIISAITAGVDFTTAVGVSSNLSGSVVDCSGATPNVSWQEVYGPGIVTFGSPNNVVYNSKCSFSTNTTVQFSAVGVYLLQLTASDGGSSQSSNILVTVAKIAPPSITTQPTDQSSIAGQTATFSVVASGSAPLSYQWQLNGVNIKSNGSGEGESSSYTTPTLTSSDNGDIFTVIVSNPAGSVTSNPAILTLKQPHALHEFYFSTQPVSVTVSEPATATFTAVASGASTPTYQWEVSTNGGKTWSTINGATGSSYTTSATSTSMSGYDYECVASDGGSITSNVATLTVNPTFVIKASSGANGSISPSGAINVNSGANQTFTVKPNSAAFQAVLTVDGSPATLTNNTYTFSDVTTPHTIAVSFILTPETITAGAGPNGSISPSGAVTVNYGTSQTFNFVPNTGYSVQKVLVDNVPVTVSSSNSYTLSNVTTNHTIAVSFTPSYIITSSAGTGGTISPSGAVSVNVGASQKFTITPNKGYGINEVLVDNVAVTLAAGNTYTISDVTAAHTITASFIPSYTITASSGANGSITPSGAINVNSGASQTFTIKPNSAAFQAVLTVDGLPATLTNNTYTFSDVTSPHTIAVSFILTPETISANAGPNGSISPSGAVIVNYGSSQDIQFYT